MRILIINPPFYRLQNQSLVHYPPSCCYMAATLEEAGFDCWVYNADYDPRKKTILGNTDHINIKAIISQSEVYYHRLHNEEDMIWQEVRDFIEGYSPDIVIISVFNTTLTAGNMIARIVKKINPKIITIFEGSANRGFHCAIDPSKVGDFSVMDFAIRREPEYTIVELIRLLKNEAVDFSSIAGLSWKDKTGDIIHNPDREFIEDLDRLPFPARHRLIGYKNMPPHCFQGIYGSRGCPFDCIFCGCHISMGYKPRMRSAKNMVDEIEYVYKRFKTRYFYICDDIFFLYKDRAREFCYLLMKKKLPVYWSAQTRAEMVDRETLLLMKKSGGQHVAVGVEVGSPWIRKLIRKENTVEDVYRCAELIKSCGLFMVAFCMIGFPWEDRTDIEATVKLIEDIQPYIVYPYIPTPANGTELAELILQKNPQGLAEFRDRCHIDPSVGFSERMTLKERKEILDWALNRFAKINKKNLLLNIFKRPFFYLALVQDMTFLKHPVYFFGYLKDYFSGLIE